METKQAASHDAGKKTLPVALQVYSVRDFAEHDFEGTIQQIKAMGYDGVELAGLYGLTPEHIREVLDANGLTAVSAHVSIDEMEQDAEATAARYKTIGCQYIAIPYLTTELCPDGSDFDRTLAVIRKMGAACNAVGLTLLYHNHDFEFRTMPDGVFALDYMYATVPADVLQTELDTCWVRVAGQNPADYIRKYAGRCPVVHLKDYIREGEPQRMYDLLGQAETTAAPQGRNGFEFRPVGHGTQDMPSILAAAADSGANWVVVEQDQSVGRTSLESARLSREYLRTQGW